jgi:hypothetical protein
MDWNQALSFVRNDGTLYRSRGEGRKAGNRHCEPAQRVKQPPAFLPSPPDLYDPVMARIHQLAETKQSPERKELNKICNW